MQEAVKPSPEAMCANPKCGHSASMHHHGKSCVALTDKMRLVFCKCVEFKDEKAA